MREKTELVLLLYVFKKKKKNPGGLKRSCENVIKEREENMEELQDGNIFIYKNEV